MNKTTTLTTHDGHKYHILHTADWSTAFVKLPANVNLPGWLARELYLATRANSELRDWHALCHEVGFAHEPETGPWCVDDAARGAFSDWCRAQMTQGHEWDALRADRDQFQQRAERAERERDATTSWRDEWHGALQRIQTALAPKLTNKWWTTDEMEAEVMRLRDDFRAVQMERDAKQSGYEALGEMLAATCAPAHDYAQEYECGHPGEDVVAVVVRDARDLRARASQAEQALATLRDLIHTASGLDDHRYSAEQMVKEIAERWQGASDDCEKAEQALATVTAERDEALRVSEARRADLTLLRRLVMGGVGLLTTGEGKETWAAIRVLEEDRDALKAKLAEAERMRDTLGRRIDEVQAALNECGAGFTGQKESTRIRALRARLAKTEKVVEAARGAWKAALAGGPIGPQWAALGQALDALAALRALDDSGGSGAAPVSASADVATPEPAGDFDDNAPAGDVMTARDHRYYTAGARHSLTRAELDELRWRVERLENLTGSGSGSG